MLELTENNEVLFQMQPEGLLFFLYDFVLTYTTLSYVSKQLQAAEFYLAVKQP